MGCSSGQLGHTRGGLHYEKNPYPLIMFLGLVGTTQAQGIPKELEESGLCGVKYPPQLSRAGAKMKPGR